MDCKTIVFLLHLQGSSDALAVDRITCGCPVAFCYFNGLNNNSTHSNNHVNYEKYVTFNVSTNIA